MNNNIARFAATGVLAVSLVASLSACSIPGASPTVPPGPASQSQAQPSRQAQPSQAQPSEVSTGYGFSAADAGFLYALDEGGVSYGSESTAIFLGHKVCNYLNAGYTTDESILTMSDAGLSAHDAAVVTGASIGAYCPSAG